MRQHILTRITASIVTALSLWMCAASARALPALQDVVMYEVNLRAFSQAGNLAGVTDS